MWEGRYLVSLIITNHFPRNMLGKGGMKGVISVTMEEITYSCTKKAVPACSSAFSVSY